MASVTREGATTINTRKIVVAGVLGAIAIVLGVTRLGFIPVPNVSGNATILHVPAIIGAVLEGPVVGVLAGAIFGIFSFLQADTPLFQNPLIAIGPRVLIGLFAWLAYRALERRSVDVAAVVAGVVGTLTNTIFVLGLGFAFGYIPWVNPETNSLVLASLLPQIIAEVIIAAILTPLVARGVNLVRSGRTSAADTTPRDKSSF